ncbi:MAG: class II fructose-bisphosphate aldolase [Anaerolineae bacterium]
MSRESLAVHERVEALRASLVGSVLVEDNTIQVQDETRLKGEVLDWLVRDAVFAAGEVQVTARWLIWELGQVLGIKPASIHGLYTARGRGLVDGFTVPAVNLRGLTYDAARALFRAALKNEVGAFIFEIARSEIGYTEQRPAEYISSVIAAALKEGFRGPLFMQGDHFQISPKKYAQEPEAELGAVRDLIGEAIRAGFYNIDIDTSTLVDLSKPTVDEQQRLNYQLCADLTAYIRKLEPAGVTISVGGEIGEVGGKNSTEEELRAFMDGHLRVLKRYGAELTGLSKISVQTGTSHGGVILPDGSLAQVRIDFDTLQRLSQVAREGYGLSGAVQHGASTLPREAFHHFPRVGTAEIHLATGFQNIIYKHEALPDELRQKIYTYLRQAHADEGKEGQTDEQFIYKTRKKGFGPFKTEWWTLPQEVRDQIGQTLEEQFAFLFHKLKVVNTADLVGQYVRVPTIHKSPGDFAPAGVLEVDKDLAD